MGLENFNYDESVESEISTEEELSNLKDSLQVSGLGEDKEIVKYDERTELLFWLSEDGRFPKIPVPETNAISLPTVVEDAAFQHLVNQLKESSSSKLTKKKMGIDQLLASLLEENNNSLPYLTVNYVTPEGKNLLMKFSIQKEGQSLVFSPNVKTTADGGLGSDQETDSDYYIKSSLDPENNWERSFSFKLKK